MPKLKTHKATAKRFRFSGAKKKRKIIRRKAGQGHFNSRESGKVTKNKRKDVKAHKTNLKIIKKLTPYK